MPGATARTQPVEIAGKTGATLVLLTLASGQFLMTLDSSVMNVSMALVALYLGQRIPSTQTRGAPT
jgi:hypothetical protein